MKRPKHVVVETSYIKTPQQYKHYKLCFIVSLPIFVILNNTMGMAHLKVENTYWNCSWSMCWQNWVSNAGMMDWMMWKWWNKHTFSSTSIATTSGLFTSRLFYSVDSWVLPTSGRRCCLHFRYTIIEALWFLSSVSSHLQNYKCDNLVWKYSQLPYTVHKRMSNLH
jgi:hypothetical protein